MHSKEIYGLPLFGKPDAVFGGADDPIRSSSAQGYCVSPVVSMETYLQSLQPNNNNEPDLSSPPNALSLRTRETSALALKQIFDQQQMINGASSTQRHHHQMGGFQEVRNQSTPYLRRHSLPDPNGTFEKTEDYRTAHAQTGYGSPISAASLQSSQTTLIPMNGQLQLQHNVVPEAVASARLNPSSRQSTAQMTIFYSGSVNVYDDVPAERAHAIMLLAGDARSTSYRCPAAPPNATPMSRPETTATMREWSPSLIKVVPSQHAANMPVMASLASPPPSPAPQTPGPLSDSMKSSQAGAEAKRYHSGIELPHARKASLARFLEKRKDRAQVQQEDPRGAAVAAVAETAGGSSLSCCDEDKPDAAAASFSSKRQRVEMASPRAPSLSRSSGNAANDRNGKWTDQEPIAAANERCFLHHRSSVDTAP